MKKPFLFKEAKLPKEFPPPGPVGEVMVKNYPAYRLARVRGAESGPSATPNEMFSPLFNHIKRKNIAMTAPVEIEYADSDSPTSSNPASRTERRSASMAFLYADPALGQLGPDPADPRVVVENVPAMMVLSVGIRGGYTDSNLAAGLERLRIWLETNPDRYRTVGPPRYLAYNSPFVPGFLKFGEVQLPVERAE